jgi:hypothetical protein
VYHKIVVCLLRRQYTHSLRKKYPNCWIEDFVRAFCATSRYCPPLLLVISTLRSCTDNPHTDNQEYAALRFYASILYGLNFSWIMSITALEATPPPSSAYCCLVFPFISLCPTSTSPKRLSPSKFPARLLLPTSLLTAGLDCRRIQGSALQGNVSASGVVEFFDQCTHFIILSCSF